MTVAASFVSHLIPVSQQLLDDVATVDYTVADVEREAATCRYCKMNRTRYGRVHCHMHGHRIGIAWIFGPRP